MAEVFELPSGAAFEVQPLSYESAWAVTQTVIKEIEKSDISSLKKLDLDFDKIMSTDVLDLKDPICHLLASHAMIDAARQCFKKCLYNKGKIDSMTFESKEARGDFIMACWHALKENILPFFGSLGSLLKTK